MTVTNKTSVTLYISGKILGPNETRDFFEGQLNSLDIHSEIGSCVITTEYGKREFMNFGKLVAKEVNAKDENGMKNILVSAID